MASVSPSCLLVQGPDTYLLRQIEAEFMDRWVDPGFRDFNVTTMEGLTAAPSVAIASARTPAFGPGGRLVIVRDCPWFVAGGLADELEQEALQELENHPLPPGGHLLLLTSSAMDRRLNLVSSLLGTPEGWFQDWRRIGPSQAPITVVSFDGSEAGEGVHTWLMRTAREKGGRLGDEEASLLVDRVGPDRWVLAQTIEKLALHAQGHAITDVMIDEMCPPGEVNVFEILDAIAAGRVSQAVVVLRRLLVTQHPLQVLAALTTMVRRWLVVRLGTEQRMSDADLAKHVGGKPYMVSKYRDKIRAWTTPQLEQALIVLARTDRDLKSTGGGKLGDEGLMLQMLAEIAPRPRPVARPGPGPRRV